MALESVFRATGHSLGRDLSTSSLTHMQVHHVSNLGSASTWAPALASAPRRQGPTQKRQPPLEPGKQMGDFKSIDSLQACDTSREPLC